MGKVYLATLNHELFILQNGIFRDGDYFLETSSDPGTNGKHIPVCC